MATHHNPAPQHPSPTTSTWRLGVCSGNAPFRSAVTALQPRVQWQAHSARDMLLKIDSHPKRSLLLIATDDLPDLRLVELVPLLTAQVQPARLRIVLFLEDQPGHDRLQALLMAGVGVICRLQRFQGPLLASAINNALLNRPWLDPHYETLRQPGGRPRPGGRWLRHPGDLPWRERELLCQVGQGYNALEISQRLGIRCDTVRRTLSRVYKRIGVRDRAQAVGWCLCHGLISSQELRRRYPLHGSLEDQP